MQGRNARLRSGMPTQGGRSPPCQRSRAASQCPLHEARSVRASVEQEVDDAHRVLEGPEQLRRFGIVAVVHVFEIKSRLREQLLANIRASARPPEICGCSGTA